MNNTLQNGFRVLELLSSTGDMYSVTEMAKIMEVPNSHACRLLKTLTETGYVEQDPRSRKYRISLKVLSLSNMCLSKSLIRRKARPFIIRLADTIKANTYLSIAVDSQPMIIDVVYSNGHGVHDPALNVGSINPVHCSASGKVCCAYHPDEDLDAFLDTCPFDRKTASTITSREVFIKQLDEIRKTKIALAIRERGENTVAAASPVFDSDGRLSGIIGADLSREEAHDQKTIEGYAATIRETAEAVSFSLGFADYENR